MASPNSAGQPKHNLRNYADGLGIVLPTPALSGQQVHRQISPFEDLIMVSTPPAESSTGRNQRPGLTRASIPPPHSAGNNQQSFDVDPSTEQVYPQISPFEDLIMVPTPLAESSSTRNHLPYDIFINHRGQDTKHSLADNIYRKLNATGLKVFLDKDELELGDCFPEALKNGIASASIQIAIFSENYAKSPWCLEELEFMLSLLPQVTFIPIFYHVEPTTLRWAIERKGIYADAFKEYEEKSRYSPEKLQRWKSALHKASFYNGESINNQL